MHQEQIKRALGIAGVRAEIFPWRSRNLNNGVQVDMLIVRADRIVNLCEMKFSINIFTINKQYDAELRNKIQVFQDETRCKYGIHLTMITTYGITTNAYANHIQSSLSMDILFGD